jgi:glycosyltransferase involved in cell wall biosynthesis
LRRLGHEVTLVAVDDHPSAARRYASLLGGAGRAMLRPPRGDEPTVVEAHIAYPTGLFAWPVAARARVPFVLFAHGSDVLGLPGRSRLDATLCRWVFQRAALVVANSRFLAGEVQARFGVPAERVALVSPGIRYADFAAARHTGERPQELLFVANLIRRKGLDVLLDALAELARRGARVPHLRVVGDGPERPALERQAAAANLTVDFAGALPQDAVAREMGAAQVLAVPSREEALGLAPLEGMAAGCVTVVSDLGGLAESVTDGVTGFSCPPEDPGALADALVRAFSAAADPGRRAALVTAADAVARQHDVDAAVAETVRHFAALTGPSRRPIGSPP